MLVPNDAGLIRNLYLNVGIVFQDYTLASKARLQARVDGTIYEVFFLFGDFFQQVFSLVDVNMTGTAGTNAAAVVVEMNVVIFSNFQNGVSRLNVLNCNRGNIGIFKYKSHCGQFQAQF